MIPVIAAGIVLGACTSTGETVKPPAVAEEPPAGEIGKYSAYALEDHGTARSWDSVSGKNGKLFVEIGKDSSGHVSSSSGNVPFSYKAGDGSISLSFDSKDSPIAEALSVESDSFEGSIGDGVLVIGAKGTDAKLTLLRGDTEPPFDVDAVDEEIQESVRIDEDGNEVVEEAPGMKSEELGGIIAQTPAIAISLVSKSDDAFGTGPYYTLSVENKTDARISIEPVQGSFHVADGDADFKGYAESDPKSTIRTEIWWEGEGASYDRMSGVTGELVAYRVDNGTEIARCKVSLP
jgi:hypothetical protein